MREGKTHYPPSVGVHELRVALARKVTRKNGIAASPFVPHKDQVRGFVYDVKSGRLEEVGAPVAA